MSLIAIDHLSKVYRTGTIEVLALDDVSFQIEQGEFVAIIGPSGSGKSTLMNILGCLDVPTSGSYLLNQVNVSTLSDNQLAEIRNREIGFVFQGFNLLHAFNAIENVELPLIYRGVPAGDRKRMAYEALSKVGLMDRMYHKPSELSGGQQQRVAIARALVGAPNVLLADEPTGNLDTKSGAEILSRMNELNQSGVTVILITHDQSVASKANKILTIQDGKIS
jgi:putative ABC transport system ATP-binding protein